MNPTFLRLRSQVVRAMRAFFDDQGFLEMHTPRLVGLPGQEPYLDPFWTEVVEASGARHKAALITSPEYLMKRLLAEGFDNIYDLGPCFRNGEPWDGSHDPEFLLLEWYRRDAELVDILDDTEAMIRYVVQATGHGSDQRWQRALRTPFRRLSMREAWRLYLGVELDPLVGERSGMANVALEHGQTVDPQDSWDDLFFKVFLSRIEPHLGWNASHDAWQPTFLTEYPASMAALARKNVQNPRYADRAELYMGDLELANGFAELCDPDEQRARFLEEQELRRLLGKETWSLDERFLEALPAMGNAAGIAFGVERFVMLLAGARTLGEVLPASAQQRFASRHG